MLMDGAIDSGSARPDSGHEAADGEAGELSLLPTILQAWGEVLNLPAVQLQADSNFFLNGGDSLQLMQVLVRIRQHLQVDLGLQDAAQFSTPRSMARWCVTVAQPGAARGERQRGQDDPEQSRALPGQMQARYDDVDQVLQDAPGTSDYPASANQQGIWLAEAMSDGRAVYNTAVGLQLDGELNTDVLEQALSSLLQRHAALRSNLRLDTGTRQLRVHIRPAERVTLTLEAATAQQACARMQELAAQPFNLAKGALWRFRLFRLAARRHLLCLCLHHAVTDGWSGAVLLRNLAEAYNALLADRRWHVPSVDTAHAAYALEQQQMLGSPRSAAWQTLEGWRRRLGGADQSGCLFEAGGQPWPYRLRHLDLALPARLMQALGASANALGVTRFTLMLAAFRLSLHALTGVRDQCIGIPVAARDSPEREQGVGCYLNLLVARTCIIADEPWQETVRRTHVEALRDLDNLQLPFQELLKELQPAPRSGGHVWFDVLFAFQNLPRAPVVFSGLRHELARIRRAYGHYVLEVEISPDERGGECHLACADDLLGSPVALQLAEHFVSQLWRLASGGSA